MARKVETKAICKMEGLAELKKEIAGITDRISGTEVQSGYAYIAKQAADMFRAEAAAKNWPKKAIDSIFSYGKLPERKRKRTGPSALFGVRKRGRSTPYAPGYVEWMAGASKGFKSREGRSKVAKGERLIGESLATMFEYGTSKMHAKPALRPALKKLRAAYPDMAKAVFQKVIESNKSWLSGFRKLRWDE